MATTNTNAAKTVAKKAAQDPKVAKVLAEETTKATIRNLGNNINKNNVLFIGLGVAATVATVRLRELYLATKAKADDPVSPLASVHESRESRA